MRAVALVAVLSTILPAAPATAQQDGSLIGSEGQFQPSSAPPTKPLFSRPLARGDAGKDVRALQVRVAGWFPSTDQVQFVIDGNYEEQTALAVQAFRSSRRLPVSGRASSRVLRLLQKLQDPDGSTKHFEWIEFTQNSSTACTAEANAYAGTFGGGMVSPRLVKRNVKRLMWRLEAVRAKAGGKAMGINSAFRSVPYNECISGASSSQHLFGAAVDTRIVETDNREARALAKQSQFYGIGCYEDLTHNHFDIRLENRALSGSQAWWWPDTDRKGRDLDDVGEPCWGQGKTKVDPSSPEESRVVIAGIVVGPAGAGSKNPSDEEVEAFESAGETRDYEGHD